MENKPRFAIFMTQKTSTYTNIPCQLEEGGRIGSKGLALKDLRKVLLILS